MSVVSCNGAVSAAATLAITKPTGLMPGDILIIACASYRSTSQAPTNATIANTGSGGSTWSAVTSRATNTYYKSAYAYKYIDTADDGSVTAYTWTATNATRMVGAVIVLRGRARQAVSFSNTAYTNSDTIIRAALIQRTPRDDIVWWGFNYHASVEATVIPSGWTSGTVQTAGAAISGAMAYLENQPGGSTGTVDGSCATNTTAKHAWLFGGYAADHAIRQSGSRMW